MSRTQSDIVVVSTPSDVMAVIADFADYPAWATGMNKVEVVAKDDKGRPRDVHFSLSVPPIRDEFTLRYTWDPSGMLVAWQLIGEATVLTAMDGSYRLTEDMGGTRVSYALEVDIKVPMLGMLKRKAEKVIIDTALKGLKKRVEATPTVGG